MREVNDPNDAHAAHSGTRPSPRPAVSGGDVRTAGAVPKNIQQDAWVMELADEPLLRRRRRRFRSLVGWLVTLAVLAGAGVVFVRTGFWAELTAPDRNVVSRSGDDRAQSTADSTTNGWPVTSTLSPNGERESPPVVSERGSDRRRGPASTSGQDQLAAAARRTPRRDSLTAELKDNRTISPTDGPGRIEGTVTVRRGTTLVIEAGTELIAERASELVVHGRLIVGGTIDAPVRLRSEQPGVGRWKGIRLEGDHCEATLRGLVVSDAEVAIVLAGTPSVDAPKFQFEACLLTGNGTGMRVDSFSSPRVTNVAIVRNRDDAIAAREDDGVYTRVTLAANGGKGYAGLGKPAPQLEDCSVVGNAKGGLHFATGSEPFRARWSVSRSNLLANGPFDLFLDHAGGVPVNEIYWGPAGLRELRALGFNEKKKPRSRIWDGLHPKHADSGVIFVQNSQLDFITSAQADAAVLRMAGGKALDLAKLTSSKSHAAVDSDAAPPPDVPLLFAPIAEQLRELIPTRQYDAAARLLDESLADPELADVADLIRAAREDVRLLQEFWQLAAARIATLEPGQPASVDGIRGELVEFRDGQLSIRAGGVVRQTVLEDLRPTDLVFFVAGSKPADDPDLLSKIWLFLLADKQGLDRDVDRWAHLAHSAGADLQGRGIYLIPKGKAVAEQDK